MLRISIVAALMALAAACAAPSSSGIETPLVSQNEPIVAHLLIGGVT